MINYQITTKDLVVNLHANKCTQWVTCMNEIYLDFSGCPVPKLLAAFIIESIEIYVFLLEIKCIEKTAAVLHETFFVCLKTKKRI